MQGGQIAAMFFLALLGVVLLILLITFGVYLGDAAGRSNSPTARKLWALLVVLVLAFLAYMVTISALGTFFTGQTKLYHYAIVGQKQEAKLGNSSTCIEKDYFCSYIGSSSKCFGACKLLSIVESPSCVLLGCGCFRDSRCTKYEQKWTTYRNYTLQDTDDLSHTIVVSTHDTGFIFATQEEALAHPFPDAIGEHGWLEQSSGFSLTGIDVIKELHDIDPQQRRQFESKGGLTAQIAAGIFGLLVLVAALLTWRISRSGGFAAVPPPAT